MNPRHSKIVCTIGPATHSPRMIRRLLQAGMDVARLNFSHGTHEMHAQSISMIHAAAAELRKTIGILADLQGPKIRTGALAGGGTVNLRSGQQFIITTAKILGDSTRVSTIFRPLPREVHSGDRILLSDGLIELRVEKVSGPEVYCRVVNGGVGAAHLPARSPRVSSRSGSLTECQVDFTGQRLQCACQPKAGQGQAQAIHLIEGWIPAWAFSGAEFGASQQRQLTFLVT